jgi:hypothetical protein
MIQSDELEAVTKEVVVYFFKVLSPNLTERSDGDYKNKSIAITGIPAETCIWYLQNIRFNTTFT